MAKAATQAAPVKAPPKILTLAKKLHELRGRKDALEEDLKKVNAEILEIGVKQLPELLSNAEIEKLTIAGVGTLYVQQELFVSVNKENTEAFYGWLRKHKHADLIKEYVFPQTLKAWTKEQLEKGNPVPLDLMSHSFVPTARIRRA